MSLKRKIILAITGASGAIYAKILIEKLLHLHAQYDTVNLVFSEIATEVWKHEIGGEIPNYSFTSYKPDDFYAPFASGSARFDTMIICPCTMGTLGRIASGFSNDLISRAADVVLKERRKLILVPRETPMSTLHLSNMQKLSNAGAIICPAMPSFYSKPQTIEQLAETLVDRVLEIAGFDVQTFRWGTKHEN